MRLVTHLSAIPCPTRNPSGSSRKYIFSRSESSSSSFVTGGLVSTKTVSVLGRGRAARLLARGTSSIRRRSMHVVERKEDKGSDEPTGGGTGVVLIGGREVIVNKACHTKIRCENLV
jgi:hypothetical protein